MTRKWNTVILAATFGIPVVLVGSFLAMKHWEQARRQDKAIVATVYFRLKDWEVAHGSPASDLPQALEGKRGIPVPSEGPYPGGKMRLLFGYDPSAATKKDDIMVIAFYPGSRQSTWTIRRDYQDGTEAVDVAKWKAEHPKATFYGWPK